MKLARMGRMAPSAGIATGLVAPLALGAPGNLDASFADHGRIVLSGDVGQAWAVEALADGGVMVAGGGANAYCGYYYCDELVEEFVNELSSEGEFSVTFSAAPASSVEVRDAVRQPDGGIVLVGRQVASDSRFWAYRLASDGSRDETFNSSGFFDLPAGDSLTGSFADSAVLGPDGKIAISGSDGERLIVVRLLADGTLDGSFGANGIFTGPAHDAASRSSIERTAAGQYRIATTDVSGCRVFGLTAAGVADSSFGVAGIAQVEGSQAVAAACTSMASQADGSLLVTATGDGQSFATRILATGSADPTFSASAVGAAMTAATAIAVDEDGRILVAGAGDDGAMIMRLEVDGDLDATFGEAGSTFVDLPSYGISQTRINALDPGPDGSLLAAGGLWSYGGWTPVPFVIKVFGDGGGGSPGVLSVVQPNVEAAEGENLVVRVRRTGGKSGSVSVDYATISDGTGTGTAIPNDDYDETAGTLTWADGDASEREIEVLIRNNDGEMFAPPEEYEGFRVELRDSQGGAGLGTRNALASILPDGSPGGQFAIDVWTTDVREGSVAEILVRRLYYFEGPVSVTVSASSGTATGGDDFDATPVTLTWADQDAEPKPVRIRIADDSERESDETFLVALTDAVGAIPGAHDTSSIRILASDSSQSRNGGGGSTGWLSVLLLGLAELLRRSLALRAAPLRPRARR